MTTNNGIWQDDPCDEINVVAFINVVGTYETGVDFHKVLLAALNEEHARHQRAVEEIVSCMTSRRATQEAAE